MKIKKLNNDAIIPSYADEGSAGMDLYSRDNMELSPGETVMIHTGIAMEIPSGYFGGVYARSGLATKKGLRPANCVGVVDSSYRGEIIVPLHNDSNKTQAVSKGDRVAQLIIQPYRHIHILQVTDELSETERGEGGFGHTGA